MTTAPPTAVPPDLARETDADLLRRAATLMRERAEAATRGPWSAFRFWDADYECWRIHTEPTGGESIEVAGGLAERGGVHGEEDARHIASWSPPPALAAADLLDRVADEIDKCRNSLRELGLGALVQPTASNPVWAAALGMARAYLNETTTTEEN